MSLYRRLKLKQKGKGEITAERLEQIESKGLKISERAKLLVGKRNQVSTSVSTRKESTSKGIGGFALQRLYVAQELRLREGHRSFTASSALFRGALEKETESKSGTSVVGQAKPVAGGIDSDSFQFNWGSGVGKWSAFAAIGLNKDTRHDAFDPALNDARLNMIQYIERKQQQAARSAASAIRTL